MTAQPQSYQTEVSTSPVEDWHTDFDHANPAYNQNVHEIWENLREECPVAHSDRYGGTWLPVDHQAVRDIAYDTENYTSRQVIVTNLRTEDTPGIGVAPPITSDPPFHKLARRLLLPLFRPQAMADWHDTVRELCNERLDKMGPIEPGVTIIDAAKQYSQYIPVTVIGRMLGLPSEDDDLFRTFVVDSLEGVGASAEERQRIIDRLDNYLDIQIADHVANPRDDMIGYLLGAELDGKPLTHQHVRGSIRLLLIAGIDTTWSAIGSSIWHLAQNPHDRQRMLEDPDVVPFAIEELLRAYAPVTMARLVAKDHEFNGCPMKTDEWVLLPFPAANRDPKAFPKADEVIIDREENRHSAFGLGIHRCLGSNLARLELQIAVEEFLGRFNNFELVDPDDVVWSLGQIRGPRELPVRIL